MAFQFELFSIEHFDNGTSISSLRLAGIPDEAHNIDLAKVEVLEEVNKRFEGIAWKSEWTEYTDQMGGDIVHALNDHANLWEINISESTE